MVYDNNFSDYGSENSSTDSSMSFGGRERWSSYMPHQPVTNPQPRKCSSFADLVNGRCTLDDVMKEFQMNGSDSPYTPDEDKVWSHRADELIGMGPSGAYLRQKSWPEPERTPIAKLPSPPNQWLSTSSLEFIPAAKAETPPETPAPQSEVITSEQIRVLSSLPNNVLFSLLSELQQARDQEPAKKRQRDECRFCKNNGERESYYRSHALKDAAGRVACPVLRAFVCKRCGASGDSAHTIKYCPRSTNEERIKSAAMMRSVRMASGRRRTPGADYMVFGQTSSDLMRGLSDAAPLHPQWAALEQKLML